MTEAVDIVGFVVVGCIISANMEVVALFCASWLNNNFVPGVPDGLDVNGVGCATAATLIEIIALNRTGGVFVFNQGIEIMAKRRQNCYSHIVASAASSSN